MTTFDEYIVLANRYYVRNKKWCRVGQAYMNALFDVHRDLYLAVCSNEVNDPFYDDANLERFMEYLEENWEK